VTPPPSPRNTHRRKLFSLKGNFRKTTTLTLREEEGEKEVIPAFNRERLTGDLDQKEDSYFRSRIF